ncbi:MAG: tetratricopeptide repeat protein [bacterium]
MREKRLATILYADLTGFTELTSKLGPERIADFVNECFRTLDSIIHIHDGTVLRHEGDRVMAIFGFPKSQGYDSYSAALSGLRILEATEELTQSIGAHLGIATGEVICEDGNVYGPVIDIASQLEGKASVGEIFIDRNCYELNKTFFDCKKIVEDKSEFYKILNEKRIKSQYEDAFLDRQKEFVELRDLIFRSEKIIFVTGEPGVGKTRFIMNTVEKLNQNSNRFNFLQTSFLTIKSRQSYEPIMKIIRDLKPDFQPDTGTNLVSESYNVKIHNQLCDVIFSASKIKPLILHFQYFDRVDTSSLEFFKFLVNNIESQDAILIFEMHEVSKTITETLQSIIKKPFRVIELPQLEQGIQVEIASKLLSQTAISEKMLNQITRCAGGNPLFLCELCNYVKHMCSKGTTIEKMKIPYRMKEIFNHLIDHIPKDILSTLSTAAIYGYKVKRSLLDVIVPDCDNAISYGLANRILEANNGDIAFANPFFRDELCNRIPISAKKEIHRKIATIIREHSSTPNADEKLAYHFKACADYDLALHYAMKWAKKMKDIHAPDLAIASYSEALDITKKTDNKAERSILLKRVELLNLAGRKEEEKADLDRLSEIIDRESEVELYEFILAKGRYLESICEYDNAIKLYEEYSGKQKRVKLLERIGMVYYCKSQFPKAIEILDKALRLARKNRDTKKEADVLSYFGVVYLKTGEKQKSLDHSKKSLALYDRLGDNISSTHVTANMANVYFYLNRYKEALNSYNQALKVAIDTGDVTFESRMLTNIGTVYVIMGEYEKALDNYSASLKIAQETMNKKWQAIILNNIGNIHGSTGKYEKSLCYFEQALAISSEIGDKAGIAIRYGNIADAYMSLNQASKAYEYLQKALDLSLELNVMDWISFYKNEMATALVNRERYDEAITVAQDAINIAQKANNMSYRINGFTTQALAYLKKGELKKAMKLSRIAINELEKMQNIEGHKSDVYYTHYKILKNMGKVHDASSFLKKAYEDIRGRGDRIVDDDLKQSFYYNIKEHKEILEEWEKGKNQK